METAYSPNTNMMQNTVIKGDRITTRYTFRGTRHSLTSYNKYEN